MKSQQETLKAFVAEIQRIATEHTAPYAPTKQRYKKLKRKEAPSLRQLKRAGYDDTAAAWCQLVADNLQLDVESRANAISRGQTLRHQMQRLNDDDFVLDDLPDVYTEYDRYPTPGMPVCSVREDSEYVYYLLR